MNDWRQAVDLGARAPEPGGAAGEDSGRQGPLGRLRHGLARSREALGRELSASLRDRVDERTWESLEEGLILADVGAPLTAQIVRRLEDEVAGGQLSGAGALRGRLAELLAEAAGEEDRRLDLSHRPAVVMVVGVNGTGKTTTIAKLAWALRERLGLSVLLGAADTYRAAAVDQLQRWAERIGCEIVRGREGGDPGAVAFDALEAAAAREIDVVICDTAGRLHTQENLMEELAKVRRVIAKRLPGAPHESLVVIDATTGQNGLRQARAFSDAVEVTGAAVTKLDGTARGGIAIAIGSELGIPVKLIGVGEGIEDLRPFDRDEFARALLAD